MNTNTKISKGPCTTEHTDGRTYYTATQGIWTHILRPHDLYAIMIHANNFQKSMRMTGERDMDTGGRKYKYIAALDPHTQK